MYLSVRWPVRCSQVAQTRLYTNRKSRFAAFLCRAAFFCRLAKKKGLMEIVGSTVPDVLAAGRLAGRTPAHPDIRTFARPDGWTSGQLDVRTSKQLIIYLFCFITLVFQFSEFLSFEFLSFDFLSF